jgi:UDP-N-acetylmuramate dehydrogenase
MQVERNKALRRYNSLDLDANADAFVNVSSETELLAALEWGRAHDLPVVPLGEGSNIVLAGDLDALVLRQQTKGIEILETARDAVKIRVAAGENWHQLVQWSLQQRFCGLQNLALIPGTVGAAPIQNIGAYGVELSSVLSRVHGIRISDLSRVVLDRDECQFGYRDSIFKRALADQVVITAIDMQLTLTATTDVSYPALRQYFSENASIKPTPQSVFDAVVSIRRSKLPDPAVEPNAGSFFKNPVVDSGEADRFHADFPSLPQYPQADGRVKLPAAWMIEHCGWKGYRRDDVGVHREHALVLVNHGNASGENLLQLATEIANSVRTEFDVLLEIEPRLLGHHT